MAAGLLTAAGSQAAKAAVAMAVTLAVRTEALVALAANGLRRQARLRRIIPSKHIKKEVLCVT